ncbi:MAG: response regulator transcription factor [Spirochaetia bacterium]|jgi:DNA-binding NarL/FixJ family response regulator|nr:response regulator transcription factor [Spirochaetia bacterium]
MQNRDIKIYIVDDHPVVRRGLGQFINSRDGFCICGEAGDAESAIADINDKNPDIVLVDINLKGTSGIDLIKAIRSRYSGVNVLVLSMHEENEYIERAMRAGAKGYILKNDSEELVFEAIASVIKNRIFLSDGIKDKVLESMFRKNGGREQTVALLTDREFEIFQLIGGGANTREIASALNLSASTIGTYRERIKTKLSILTPNELVKFAVQWVMNEKNKDSAQI